MLPAQEPNPWLENPETLAGSAIAQLTSLAALIKANQTFLPKPALKLAKAIPGAVTSLQADEMVYRTNRRLFVQQIPAFVGLVTALKSARESGEESAEVKAVISDLTKNIADAVTHLHAELSALSSARVVAEATDAQLGWSALPGLASRSVEAVTEVRNKPVDRLRGLAGATVDAVGGVAGDAVSSLGTITAKSARRVNAVGKLAQVAGTTALTTVKAHTLDRALLYGNAAVKTVWATGGLAVVVGLVTLVIFAPAAPLAAGLMVFSAPSTFADILAEDMTEAERERALRNAGAGDDFMAAWAELKGQRMIRLDTEYVTADLDVVAKTADGTVLAGRYAGQRLSSLLNLEVQLLIDYAPDAETRSLLEQYQATTRPKERAAVAYPQDQPSVYAGETVGLIGLGLEALLIGASI